MFAMRDANDQCAFAQIMLYLRTMPFVTLTTCIWTRINKLINQGFEDRYALMFLAAIFFFLRPFFLLYYSKLMCRVAEGTWLSDKLIEPLNHVSATWKQQRKFSYRKKNMIQVRVLGHWIPSLLSMVLIIYDLLLSGGNQHFLYSAPPMEAKSFWSLMIITISN